MSGADRSVDDSPGSPRPSCHVDLRTSLGTISIALYGQQVPVTVANFLRYVDRGLLAEACIYRVVRREHWVPGREMEIVQGGLGLTPEKMLDPIPHESPTDTGLLNRKGAISMARGEPGTATSEFFVCLEDCLCLDPTPSPTPPHDGLGYAVFGEVTEGLEILKEIQMLATLDDARIDLLKGQLLIEPVRILGAERRTIS